MTTPHAQPELCNDSSPIQSAPEAALVPDSQRMNFLPAVFGRNYLRCEQTVYALMSQLSPDYQGGLWEFLRISSGGAYMRPTGRDSYLIRADNGFEGTVSQDAAGIIVNLYAFSHLSFDRSLDTDKLSDGYHALREFAMRHAEVRSILQAID